MKKIILLFLIISLLCLNSNFFAQTLKDKNPKNGELTPKPKNIKESTSFYIYILWIWLVIFVLIYIIILKIKEVDRAHKMGFNGFNKNTKK